MRTSPSIQSIIDRAIVPAAGFGARLRPLTSAIPKEMLPLGRKPVLEHVLDELRAAGIRHVLLVISPNKEMVRGYFGDGSDFGMNCDYAIQPEMKGLGDAILCGESWVDGRAFAVAFGDCTIESPGSPLSRVIETHAACESDATVLTEEIPVELTGKYGIVAPRYAAVANPGEPVALRDIVEKPKPHDAPSNLAVAARWVFQPGILENLRATAPGPDGEVNLTEAVRTWIREGGSAWAVPLREGERRCDIGGWDTYLAAAARYAIADSEYGEQVRTSVCRGWL